MALPPVGFKFPSKEDYTRGLVQGLDSVAPLLKSKGEELLQPVKLQAAALISAAEKTTGMSVADLASLSSSVVALAQSGTTSNVIAVVQGVLNGSIKIGVQLAQAVGAAADVVQVVPIIGQMVGAILAGMEFSFKSKELWEQQKVDCDKTVQEQANQGCAQLVEAVKAKKSAFDDIRPADLFRPVAFYAFDYRRKYPLSKDLPVLPLSIASIYVLLCGKEAESVGGFDTQYSAKIPFAVQRRMWILIKGILASIEDPLEKPLGGDGGRSLFPMLQSIVFEQRRVGNLTQSDVEGMARVVAGYHKFSVDCGYPGYPVAGARYIARASCLGRVNLAEPFWDSLIAFRNAMYNDKFWDVSKGTWKFPVSGTIVLRSPSVITMAKAPISISELLKKDPGVSQGDGSGGLLSSASLAPKMALAAGAGVATWFAVRRLARKN